jgi:rhodanese-related sulfurtransferase
MAFLSKLFGRLRDASSEASPARISPEEFKDRFGPGAAVIDVRTPAEFAGGRVSGATNVNVMARDFGEQVEALGVDREQPVYLYCRSGGRSARAAKILRQRGYAGAVNVGGFGDLARAGVPTER